MIFCSYWSLPVYVERKYDTANPKQLTMLFKSGALCFGLFLEFRLFRFWCREVLVDAFILFLVHGPNKDGKLVFIV